jgi:hypothetical protein
MAEGEAVASDHEDHAADCKCVACCELDAIAAREGVRSGPLREIANRFRAKRLASMFATFTVMDMARFGRFGSATTAPQPHLPRPPRRCPKCLLERPASAYDAPDGTRAINCAKCREARREHQNRRTKKRGKR